MDVSETEWLSWLEPFIGLIGLFLVAFLLHLLTKRYIFNLLRRLANRLLFSDGQALLGEEPFVRLALVVPFTVIQVGIQLLGDSVALEIKSFVQRVALAVSAVLVARVISAFLDNINDIYIQSPMAQRRPIKGYLQVVALLVYMVATILALAALMDRSPLIFLSGLGAMTAVLMLVFRDTILSLVAGVQLTGNDLLRVGDWIEMPQFGADGDVVDIALNVVKVQNWDRTITVIPAHKFIEHSFKNWRGMKESGGRRIKRAIFIDIQSIHFLSDEEVDKFQKFRLLENYISQKREALKLHNESIPSHLIANSRRLTNIGTFRAYVASYLRDHPLIHKNMTFLVRQLQPGPEGLPLEVYVFSKDIVWANYEAIQADIFDHLFAIIPEFGLRVFQKPSGLDLRSGLSRPDPRGPSPNP